MAEIETSLDTILPLLRSLDDSSFGLANESNQFLEIKKGINVEEVIVNGNASGLIHMARLILEVAQKGFVGAHQHFDADGGTDICEIPLVISFKMAE